MSDIAPSERYWLLPNVPKKTAELLYARWALYHDTYAPKWALLGLTTQSGANEPLESDINTLAGIVRDENPDLDVPDWQNPLPETGDVFAEDTILIQDISGTDDALAGTDMEIYVKLFAAKVVWKMLRISILDTVHRCSKLNARKEVILPP